MKKILLIVFSSIIFFSCNKEENFDDAVTPYFRLKSFFNSEMKRMYAEKRTLNEVCESDGSFDELIYPYPDWYRAFEPFVDCDINKPELNGKYSVDSALTKNSYGDTRMQVNYRAKEKNLDTQILTVKYDSLHNVVSIHIEVLSEGKFSSVESKLDYVSGKRILIKSKENSWMMGESTYGTDGKIGEKF